MIFKVKAQEIWKWEEEIEAENEEELEQILEDEFVEHFESESADFDRNWEIVNEVTND